MENINDIKDKLSKINNSDLADLIDRNLSSIIPADRIYHKLLLDEAIVRLKCEELSESNIKGMHPLIA